MAFLQIHIEPRRPVAEFMTGSDRDHERDGSANDGPDADIEPWRVLIVEDEFFIALSTEIMLQGLGHEVVGTAATAAEAERLAAQFRPDLILMDIRLIGQRDGIDAATSIHANLGIRSFFVSANTDPLTRRRALAANPLGFIEKPLTDRQLSAEFAALKGKL